MGDEVLLRNIRGFWPGVLVLNRAGADLPTRIADIDNGTADVIAVASMSLANPDLVERIKTNALLNAPDPSTFYGGGTKATRITQAYEGSDRVSRLDPSFGPRRQTSYERLF